MTNINIAINGLGRIGKLLLRELIDRDMNVSLVNEFKGDSSINSELIEHDTVHGKWKRNITSNKSTITIDKNNIIIIAQLFSDDGLKSFSIKKIGDKKFPEKLGISAGKELLKKSEGYYKKKR